MDECHSQCLLLLEAVLTQARADGIRITTLKIRDGEEGRHCFCLFCQTDIPGETQEVEQEGSEIFYLVTRLMSNSLPGIPWHLRFKVKFLYF